MKEEEDSVLGLQEGGDHYNKMGHYQPWEVLKVWLTPEEFSGFMKGTMIAYLAREKDKGGKLDIQKAVHTGQGYLELLEANPVPASQVPTALQAPAAASTYASKVELLARELCAANFKGMEIDAEPTFFINKHWPDWKKVAEKILGKMG